MDVGFELVCLQSFGPFACMAVGMVSKETTRVETDFMRMRNVVLQNDTTVFLCKVESLTGCIFEMRIKTFCHVN